MNKLLTLSLTMLLVSPAAFAHNDYTTTVYKGSDSARRVCMSIVADDVTNLQTALRQDRFKTKRITDNSHTYQCNDMTLADFAEDRGAYRTLNFLAPERQGRVDMEDVASR